jgi:uncharacterized protein
LKKMVCSGKQAEFGTAKETALPGYCRGCDMLFACGGGCPKHRFAQSPQGDPGLNYLCAGMKNFYRHIKPSMNQMVGLLRNSIPVQKIMETVDRPEPTGQGPN